MRTLCDGPILVQIGGSGEDLFLRIKDGTVARFAFATADFEQVLSGVPIHLSAPGESAMIFRQGDTIRIAFTVVGRERSLGVFAAADLRQGLDDLKAGRLSPPPPDR